MQHKGLSVRQAVEYAEKHEEAVILCPKCRRFYPLSQWQFVENNKHVYDIVQSKAVDSFEKGRQLYTVDEQYVACGGGCKLGINVSELKSFVMIDEGVLYWRNRRILKRADIREVAEQSRRDNMWHDDEVPSVRKAFGILTNRKRRMANFARRMCK